MKNLFKYILCLSAFAGDVQSLLAQNIDVFFFAPTATMNTNFTGATAAYINPDSCGAKPNRTATGYSSVRLDNQTAPIFRTMMAGSNIQKTYDSLTNAASKLRRRILQIRGLSNGLVNDVEIYLFNDNAGLAATDNCKCSHPIPAGRGVWACASNFKQSNGKYLGYVFLGESAATAIIAPHRGGWWAWNGTVIHEFSHTQFAMEYDATGKPISNKWGFNGLAISYGGDESHWGDELQADQQSALDEGLATFWGLESNRAERDTLVNWLNRKNRRLVLGSHSFLTGVAEMWDAPHGVILNTTIPADRKIQRPGYNTSLLVNPNIQTGARYELRDYRWLDVPGKFEFYNEQIFQGYALLFFENAMRNRNNSFAMMLRAAQKMTPPNNKFRYPAVLANALAIELEAYASTADGRADETNHALVSSMFAYGMFDIITHFGMSEADLKREFSINMATYVPSVAQPKAFTNYWAHRDALKQRVCPFLGGPNCTEAGNIDITRAAAEAKAYFTDATRILR